MLGVISLHILIVQIETQQAESRPEPELKYANEPHPITGSLALLWSQKVEQYLTMMKSVVHCATIVLLLANAVFLVFLKQNIVPFPWQSPKTTASQALASLTTVAQQRQAPQFTGKLVTVRACLIFCYGVPNYEVFKAWIEYHNKRWGLTHVDLFVAERVSDMSAILNFAFQDSVKIEVIYSHLHERPGGKRQTAIMNRALSNAKLNNNTFVLYSDLDEFLVSDDFRDFEQMFERGHDAVTFPTFGSSYKSICSDDAWNFGSLGYQGLLPHSSNFSNNASLDYYTDPKVACGGARKFVVRAEKWDRIAFVHDPVTCSRKTPDSRVFDLTGRHHDGQHARLLHVRGGVGIHSDLSMRACAKVRSCKYVADNGECTNDVSNAKWELRDSEMTELLKDRPFFPDVAQVSLDAVCYAERYPPLRKEYCDDDNTKCRYGALYGHFQDSGQQNNLTWGCKVYQK